MLALPVENPASGFAATLGRDVRRLLKGAFLPPRLDVI